MKTPMSMIASRQRCNVPQAGGNIRAKSRRRRSLARVWFASDDALAFATAFLYCPLRVAYFMGSAHLFCFPDYA
jgi:hypothetical protein